MRKTFLISMLTFTSAFATVSEPTESPSPAVTIIYTTDVHGHFFPYDFINGCPAQGSLSRAATAIDSIRQQRGAENVVLLDNGDILQGQPTVYYYNFIDTVSKNIVADIHEYMGYDAATIGNHDIETGHAVYDRLRLESPTPILGANVIDRSTGEPYFKPYHIIMRGGLKIAVIGLITPAIPAWLPERLWSGLEFLPMQESARHWVDYVRENENPDIVIGLFHSGRDSSSTTAGYRENESLEIARNIAGFDAILMGHDHQTFCQTVTAPDGHLVQVLNPANNADNIGIVEFFKTADGGLISMSSLQNVDSLAPSKKFLDQFSQQRENVNKFVSEQISTIENDISTREAYFGPSAFMTLLHRLQLSISGADISMAAPLTFDGIIRKGPLTISDMFTLYKYENTLCTLRLTGREIKDYLEFSYDLWTDRISDDQPHLISFQAKHPTPENNRLKHASYNFDSAYGIDYTVDVSAPRGEKINIIGLSSGKPFELDSFYTVAINSYRAGGGGNHLTDGAGLTPRQLKERLISSTDKDLRYYLMKELRGVTLLRPEIQNNWQFIPQKISEAARVIDSALLFGEGSSKLQK